MTKHSIAPEELMAYLDGELLPDRAAAAATHLEACRECQSLAADFQGVSRQLLSWQVKPIDHAAAHRMAAALKQTTPEEPVAERRRGPVWFRRPFHPAWVPCAAGLAGLFIAGFVLLPLGNRGRYPAPPVVADSFGARDLRTESRMAAPAAPANAAPSQSKDGALEPAGPMIVRTAQLVLTARDFNAARPAIDALLKRENGYAGELTVNSPSGGSRTLTATLRIPAARLDAAMAELSKLGRVESESQNGQDVTRQSVDLDARLTNARHTEQRLTDLLRDRTGKLSDVLAVEEQIDRVRGEIDQMAAEQKTMLAQVAYATLNLTVSEDYQAKLNLVPDSAWTRFRNAAVGGYRTMTSSVMAALLFVIAYGPTILLWGGLLLAVRFGWRRWRRAA